MTIILIICEMQTRALHKTLVHANRLKAYNESHKSHKLTENKDNEKEQKQISLPPVRLIQVSVRTQLVDGQTTLRVGSQNTIERALCSKPWIDVV